MVGSLCVAPIALTRSRKDSDQVALAYAPRIAQLVRGRLSDAGGPRFESQAGRVTGERQCQASGRKMAPAETPQSSHEICIYCVL